MAYERKEPGYTQQVSPADAAVIRAFHNGGFEAVDRETGGDWKLTGSQVEAGLVGTAVMRAALSGERSRSEPKPVAPHTEEQVSVNLSGVEQVRSQLDASSGYEAPKSAEPAPEHLAEVLGAEAPPHPQS